LGHERRDEKTKISRRFRSFWLADTGNLNLAANSLMLVIMPEVKDRSHGKFKQLNPIANKTLPLEQR
jgi:hypothetical protein